MSTLTRIWLIEQVADYVTTVTINHPPANVLTPQGLKELDSTLDDLTDNDRVKVIVLTGTGRFFIAGADIRMLAEIGSRQKGKKWLSPAKEFSIKLRLRRNPLSLPLTVSALAEDWNWHCVVI